MRTRRAILRVIIASSLALGVVFLTLCLFPARSEVPFAFLKGATVIPRGATGPFSSASLKEYQGTTYAYLTVGYTLPVDYDILNVQAEKELSALGFARFPDDTLPLYSRPHQSAPAEGGLSDRVSLAPDRRYLPGKPASRYSIRSEEREGWTGVRVGTWKRLTPPEAVVFRCRQWVYERTGL